VFVFRMVPAVITGPYPS